MQELAALSRQGNDLGRVVCDWIVVIEVGSQTLWIIWLRRALTLDWIGLQKRALYRAGGGIWVGWDA